MKKQKKLNKPIKKKMSGKKLRLAIKTGGKKMLKKNV